MDRTKQGLVKFDIDVFVPGLGNFPVKSEYSRLKPKYERKHVDSRDLEVLCANLLEWVKADFVTASREDYFKQLAATNVLFMVYSNPLPELYSQQMDLCIKLCFWLWYNDDVIENAIENNIPFNVLKRATDQLEAILMGKYDSVADAKFEDVPNYPAFGNLFDSLLKLHNFCRKTLPEYESRVKNLSNCLKGYFCAQRWICIDAINGRYSEETFRTHRKIVAFFDGIADAVALVHGVALSDDMSNSPIMKRILEITNVFGGSVNDLLGMKKEFANGEKDNLIVFKVLEQKIPIDVATQEVVNFLESELSDYVLLKQVILKEFDHDYNLVRYLDILDSLIDGHNVMYIESARHCCVGSVSLTR